MNSGKKTLYFLIALFIIAIVFILLKKPATAPDSDDNNTHNNDSQSMIDVTSPKEGETVDATNGFEIKGTANRAWYFEATAPYTVYSKDGTKLVQSYITAVVGDGEDWMTNETSSFSAQVMPFLTKGATEGYIIFENSNPSDDEGFRKSFRVNVKFSAQETQTIKVYFGNTEMNPNSIDCNKVFAVDRLVPKATSIGKLSIETLLLGPTQSETELGYVSAFGNQSGSNLKSLNIKNGIASADFSYLPSGGSCLVGQARAQIEETLKQFSSVKTVKILLNGSEDEALQP